VSPFCVETIEGLCGGVREVSRESLGGNTLRGRMDRAGRSIRGIGFLERVDEESASEFWFKPGAFWGHDLAGVCDVH